MALPDVRHRSGYLLLAVVVGHLILISAQVNSPAGVPLLQAAAFAAYAEAQRATSAVIGAVGRLWSDYIALRNVRIENDALKEQNASLQVRIQQQQALAERAEALRRLLDLRDQSNLPMRAAEVIGGPAAPDFRSVTIDRGTADGLRVDMAVVAAEGAVGRVVTVARRAAKVQLLVDRNAAAAALTERTRAQGIVVGTGEDTLRLDFVSSTADVAEGDLVVTSGLDGIYPKGFVIGRVEAIERAGTAYRAIRVRPAVNFAVLEEVLVVLAAPEAGSEGRQ